MNNLAVGAVIAGVLSPWIAGRAVPLVGDLMLVFTPMALHIGAQVAVRRLLKSED